MTAKRLLLGTTVLTSLAVAGMAPPAMADDLILDNGQTQNVETSANYNAVVVGRNTLGNQLNVKAGATLTSNVSIVSENALPSGQAPAGAAGQNMVIVSGTGAKWETVDKAGINNSGSLYLGKDGSHATLSVEQGGLVSAAQLFVMGDRASSQNNSAEIMGNGASLSARFIYVGRDGDDNTLFVRSGGTVSSTYGAIGNTASSSKNTVEIRGIGSSWGLTGGLVVGNSGDNNSLFVSDGGRVTASDLYIGGDVSRGNNKIDVSGSGSAPEAASSLFADSLNIGNDSVDNSLTVSGNSRVKTGTTIIGLASDADYVASGNTASIYGPYAQWDIKLPERGRSTADLIIGYSDFRIGNGQAPVGANNNSLTILNGARVTQTGGRTVVGVTEWDTGNTLEISGAGSSFSTDGALTVNNGNSLIVGTGAWLHADSLSLSETSLLRVYVADDVIDSSLPSSMVSCAASSCLPVNQGPSHVDIDGKAHLDGKLEALIGTENLQKNRYTLLTAGSIDGTFADYELIADYQAVTAMKALNAELLYSDTEVYLSMASEIGAGQGLDDNQSSVSRALNTYYNNGGELPPGFMGLFDLSGPDLEQALSGLAGEPGATGGAAAAGQASNSFLSLLLGGFGPQRQHAPGMTHTAEAAQAAGVGIVPTADVPPAPTSGWSMWGSAYGGTADLSGNDSDGSHDTGTDAMGLATGWDYALSDDTRLGFALAGGGTRWDIDGGMGSGDSTFLQLGGYGSQQLGASYVSLAGAYAWHAMSTERHVNIGGTRENLDADFNASNLAGRAEAGHRFGGTLGLTPYAAFQAQTMYLPSYEENGGAFALDYDSSTATAARAELGLGVDGRLGSTASLHARAAWAHDWVSDPSVNASFQSLPGANFTVYGAEAPADLALISAGADMALSDAASLSADFNGEFAEGYQSYTGSLKLAYSW